MDNPWMGPSSYEEPKASDKQEYKFCGRDNATWELTSLINDNLYVTLYGRSGIGKTSLLNAGVFPKLRAMGYLPVVVRFSQMLDDFRESPAAYLIYQIQKELAPNKDDVTAKGVLELCDWNEIDALWAYFSTHKFEINGKATYPAIVLDQFEEIFNVRKTVITAGENDMVELLMKQLYSLTDDNKSYPDGYHEANNFRLIFSIREDYLYTLEDCIDKYFLTKYKYNRYRLKAPSKEEGTEIITGPGEELLPREDEEKGIIVAKIISNAKYKDDGNISPFMLSLICSELFKKALAVNELSPKIDTSMIPVNGENILRDFYLGVVKDLSHEEREHLEDDLVDSNRMRNSVNIGMMNRRCPSWHSLLEGSNHILQEVNGKVELVHDMLAGAIFDIREKRREQRLAELTKQKEEKAKQDERKRIFKYTVAVFSAIMVCIAAFSFIKISESNKKLKISQSRLIAGTSMRLVDNGNTFLAQIIALQGLPPNRTYTPEAEDALRYALSKKFTKIYGHTRDVLSARFSPDGKHIVSTSTDGIIRIWDSTNGLCVKMLERQYENFNFAEYSPDGRFIITTSDNGRACLWDVETCNIVISFLNERLQYRKIISACLSPDGNYFAFVPLSDKTIQVYGLSTDNSFYKELKTTLDVNSVAFSPDGDNIVATTSSGKVEIWNLEKGECVKTLDATSAIFNSACYSPDGESIVTASADSLVRIWNVESGKCTKILRGHNSPVLSASYSHDGKYVISSSNDGTVRIWVGEYRVLEGHNGIVYSASFSPDDKYIVSASSDQTIGLWSLTEEESIFKTSVSYLRYSNFSPDGKHFIYETKEDDSSGKYALCIRNIESDECVDTLHGHTQRIKSALYSNDGKYIVSASADSTVRVWEVANGNCIKVIHGNSETFSYASFSPDREFIMSISSNNTLRIWNSVSGECVYAIKDFAKYATFAPDNKHIATVLDSCIFIYDVSTGERQLKIVQSNEVHSVSYSPNGMYIVTALDDGTINILDVQTGKLITTLNKHERANFAIFCPSDECANFASFSSDGNYIVSSCSDYKSCIQSVLIWGVSTGVCVKSYKIGSIAPRAFSAVFSPDSRYIAVFAHINSQIWSFPSLQELIDETRERFKNRPLTLEERQKYYLE